MGIVYICIGVVLLLWGGWQMRRALRPFRLRPFLLVALGAVMIYSGLRMDW